MPVTGVTQSAQAYQAYTRMDEERGEQARAERAIKAAASISDAARVRKRSIGISLGKFGLDFTAHDVELDYRQIAGQSPSLGREGFDADLEAAQILYAASESSPVKDTAPAEPDTSRLTRAKALQAYAQAALNFDNIPGNSVGSI
ncbi:hypothetical protein [Desulfocurvus sp. DL9XJH121]